MQNLQETFTIDAPRTFAENRGRPFAYFIRISTDHRLTIHLRLTPTDNWALTVSMNTSQRLQYRTRYRFLWVNAAHIIQGDDIIPTNYENDIRNWVRLNNPHLVLVTSTGTRLPVPGHEQEAGKVYPFNPHSGGSLYFNSLNMTLDHTEENVGDDNGQVMFASLNDRDMTVRVAFGHEESSRHVKNVVRGIRFTIY